MYHSGDANYNIAQKRSSGNSTSTISHILKRMRTAVDDHFKEKLPWSTIKQDTVKVRILSTSTPVLHA